MSISNGSISHDLPATNGGGYSSLVKLFLLIAGTKVRVSQVGGGVLYFQEATLLPAKQATLVVDVDGRQTQREINILDNDVPATRIRFT